ncbi:hypothetical protein CDAR_381251 [Caerostris darwini]|uniref:Uncharacterized protein n=1 Tax=Caerostris darwini TaxID=1538125 RepID=A0AAV4Q9A9_9ARAC|nr:hypothetical protein CDAR_381251 [Caerostris darwini]
MPNYPMFQYLDQIAQEIELSLKLHWDVFRHIIEAQNAETLLNPDFLDEDECILRLRKFTRLRKTLQVQRKHLGQLQDLYDKLLQEAMFYKHFVLSLRLKKETKWNLKDLFSNVKNEETRIYECKASLQVRLKALTCK